MAKNSLIPHQLQAVLVVKRMGGGRQDTYKSRTLMGERIVDGGV